MDLPGAWRAAFSRRYRDVDVAEAERLLSAGAVLLDVRDAWEWQAGRAPGARHIPLAALPGRLAELPTDRPVVVICRSGNRSAAAAALLARTGRTAVNLAGGMRAWAAAGHPVVADGGRPGSVA
ncbi:MAG: rhodanese-like domain-containing protein [Mycobacterium leprae]